MDAGGVMTTGGWVVIAATGDRFVDFSPYVGGLAPDGTVVFQAALASGGMGVFAGAGGGVTDVATPPLVATVTSHAAVSGSGAVSFYGALPDGTEGVFLVAGGRLGSLADTKGILSSIGPLGPTCLDTSVAFRGERAAGVAGIHVAHHGTVSTIAETGSEWAGFEGLPLACGGDEVVFRAARPDGVHGIYRAAGGPIVAVAETGDVYATLGLFPFAGPDRSVTFAATLQDGGAGIFRVDRAGDTRTVERDGAFEFYRGAVVAGATVVRIATPHGGELGLFRGPDPMRDRLLAIGDPLLGSTVTDLAANPVSVNAAGQLAVRAALADGRQLILRAETQR